MLLLLAAPRGLEPRNPESEAGVLPIRLRGMAGVEGFEPSNAGVKVLCLTAWLHPNINKTQYRYNLSLSQTRKPIPPKS